MKKLYLALLLIVFAAPLWAQLSEKELSQLTTTVQSKYQLSQIDGASLYKTSSGYQVLVVVASVTTDKHSVDQNTEAQSKATRLASEYLSGAYNHSVTMYSSESSANKSKESLSDKIIQSSAAQVREMQPLCKMQGDDGQTAYAYYLVISKTAAKNGVAGVLSIIPGVGQFYKGNTGKGIMFLGLGAASATGIIVCENTRSSYANKAIEQPKHKKEYDTKSKNWATGRNVCIGVGGAIWVWNIIDAFATKSAKRKVVTSHNNSFSFQPFAAPDITGQGVDLGVGMTFNF